MSPDPLEKLMKQIKLILVDYDLGYIEQADICNRIEPRIKTYGEQCRQPLKNDIIAYKEDLRSLEEAYHNLKQEFEEGDPS